jgi:hypothetical protein
MRVDACEHSGQTALVWLDFSIRVNVSFSRQISAKYTSTGREKRVVRNMGVALNR